MMYRREIDGLRAIAVLSVVFFHAEIPYFRGGFVGVDIFFVISGYLIGNAIISELQQGTLSLVDFYERRARRILPALFVVLGSTVVFAWFWLLPNDLVNFSKSLLSVSGFVSNLYFWKSTDYFQPAAELMPLLHTWSLSVEEQFYIFFPLFALIIWRYRENWFIAATLILCAVSIMSAQWASGYAQVANFYLLPTRAFELLSGVLVATMWRKKIKLPTSAGNYSNHVLSAIGIGLILVAVLTFDRSTPFPSVYAVVPVLGAVLLILFCDNRTIIGTILCSKALVGLGLISYSLYLWHQPLFAFTRIIFFNELGAVSIFILICIAVLLSALTWRFIELPFRDRSRVKRKKVLFGAITGTILFASVGLAGSLSDGFPGRMPAEVRALLSHVNDSRKSYDDGCHLEKSAFQLIGCVKGAPEQSPSVALIGDSHAASLVQELDHAMRVKDRSFVQYTKNGCPFALGFIKKENEYCDQFLRRVVVDLSTDKIKVVIVASFWNVYLDNGGFDNGEGGVRLPLQPHSETSIQGVDFYEEAMVRRTAVLEAYTRSIIKLLGLGKKVILIYPIPEPGWDIPASFSKAVFLKTSPYHGFAPLYAEHLRSTREVRAALDSIPDSANLVRVMPSEILCDTYVPDRCTTFLDRQLLYTDNNHLSNAGARLVVNSFIEKAIYPYRTLE
jgi:peptidoglycan/LPS O-acetylase OafA/YrhL